MYPSVPPPSRAHQTLQSIESAASSFVSATLPAVGPGTVMPTSQPVTTGTATLPAVGSGTVMPTSQPVTTGATSCWVRYCDAN